MKYTKSSEWVSVGHPDRCADYIAASIINEIYKKDGKDAHAAIEVALFDNKVIIGGEAKTTLDLTPKGLEKIIFNCLDKIGYNQTLRKKFSKNDVYINEDYEILSFVNPQSPDIAKGTTDLISSEPGFNDQGTYVGYASSKTSNGLSLEHYLATSLGNYLYEYAKQDNHLGIDIKTLIQIEYNDDLPSIKGITIACPTTRDLFNPRDYILNILHQWVQTLPSAYQTSFNNCKEITINGTGSYYGHGSKCDSGLTGRKLVVNQCGNYAAGGSMIKPILASDRLLNLYARHIAKTIVDGGYGDEIIVELSASIGQTKIGSLKINGVNKDYDKIFNYFNNKPLSPNYLNKLWKTLERSNFDEVVFNNFFGSNDYILEPWENTIDDVEELKKGC